MAYNYSPYELKQMQADAIRRVNEMQSRAQAIADIKEDNSDNTKTHKEDCNQDRKEDQCENHRENRKEEPNEDCRENRSENKKSTKPAVPICTMHTTSKRYPPQKYPKHTSTANSFLGDLPNRINSVLQNDELCEQTLLIAIIILLTNEKADKVLILALLYILAD